MLQFSGTETAFGAYGRLVNLPRRMRFRDAPIRF
jgi:hypothetical protein